jgi:hypothetical protein
MADGSEIVLCLVRVADNVCGLVPKWNRTQESGERKVLLRIFYVILVRASQKTAQ